MYRKCGTVATGLKSGNNDAEKNYQNLKTSQLSGNGEIASYDTLELYHKEYETIDEYSLEGTNYAAKQDNAYLDVIAETDDEYVETDDNDYATTEDYESEQTEANIAYQAKFASKKHRLFNEAVDEY